MEPSNTQNYPSNFTHQQPSGYNNINNPPQAGSLPHQINNGVKQSQPGKQFNFPPPNGSKKVKKHYEGYNFDFSKEKGKVKIKIDEEFKDLMNDYEILQLLGKGSYGLVVKAKEKCSGNLFAIKKYMHLYRDKVDCMRILREVAILRRLSHPNIVKLHDILIPNETTVESVYLVIELLDTDIKTILNSSSTVLTEKQIKKIMSDILRGLDYIHKCGVIHRDLKPANVVINLTKCEAKICDFGLARDMILEYDTPTLMNLFLSRQEPQQAEQLKALLNPQSGEELPQHIQDFLNENFEILSNELFHLYAQGDGGILSPKNFLSEIEKDEEYIGFQDYYMSYQKARMKDSTLKKTLTHHVVTRWYRAPEIILMEPVYSSAVDMWSLGCIFGELLSKLKGHGYKGPLFPGQTCHPLSPFVVVNEEKTIIDISNDDQLISIVKVIGPPTKEETEFISNPDALEHLQKICQGFEGQSNQLLVTYPYAKQETLKFFLSFLTFDPKKRITVKQALAHNYFDEIASLVSNPQIEPKVVCLDFDKDHQKHGFHAMKSLFLQEFYQFKKDKNVAFLSTDVEMDS